MSDDKKLKNALNVYNMLCAMLDEKGLQYNRHEEDLVVTFTLGGEDIPMQFILNVDDKRELIRLLSPIPVTFDGDKRADAAIATCQVNYGLVDGSFDFDYERGKIVFRMTSSYIDSLISKDIFEYMIAIAGMTVDDYNDKFFMLAKGQLPLESFFDND